MEDDQNKTLDRAIGYCLALWDFNIFESIPACQSETIQVFHLSDTVLIDEFYTVMLNLLPPDEFY